MAKASLPRWNASTSFRFKIDNEFKESLLDGLSRDELSLAINVSVGDNEYGSDLYPDRMADGTLTFELDGDDHVLCKIDGSFEIDFTIDGNENQEIRDANADATCLYLGDPDGNFHDPASNETDPIRVGKLDPGN